MTILVFAEHEFGLLSKSALHAVTAALPLGPVTLILMGHGAETAANEAASIHGVAEVVCLQAPALDEPMAETSGAALAAYVKSVRATHLFAAASPLGKSVLPRAAALLDVMQLSEVVRVVSSDTFVRPVYAGSALMTLKSADVVKVVTIRVSAFAAASAVDSRAPVKTVQAEPGPAFSRLVSRYTIKGGDVVLADARVVISGGRGMGSAAHFALLDPVARKLGAAIGASRAAVDAGFAAPERQVGQTGKIIAPELYIAVGISGAVQHLAGMKDSRVIVAINKDAEAPIFQVADYGIVADLFDVLPELEKAI
jgi:electron transfer flavoprotein alpha subunit